MFSRTLTFAQRTAKMRLGAGARTMATRSPKEFLCIIPDKPNVLRTRKRVKRYYMSSARAFFWSLLTPGKPALRRNQAPHKSGRLVAGGAILEKHPNDDATEASFRGSVVVYTGESPGEVKAIFENDIYATSGVWGLEKAQIIAYVAAVRQPLSS